MKLKTKLLLFGGALCLVGAGFGSPPVMVVGIALVVAGLIMTLAGRL